MSPIERACRAAHAEHNTGFEPRVQADDPLWDGWKSWLPVVIAVLQVMREPSERMVDAAYEQPINTGRGYDVRANPREAGEIWQAMIDAALEEG